jgi:hypothetical protein
MTREQALPARRTHSGKGQVAARTTLSGCCTHSRKDPNAVRPVSLTKGLREATPQWATQGGHLRASPESPSNGGEWGAGGGAAGERGAALHVALAPRTNWLSSSRSTLLYSGTCHRLAACKPLS